MSTTILFVCAGVTTFFALNRCGIPFGTSRVMRVST